MIKKHLHTSLNSLKVSLYLIFLCLAILMQVVYPDYAAAQQIVINEFVSSNAATLADEDGDFEDWIELYNYGDTPVNLQGWGLSDDFSNPFKWVFPQKTLNPGEFILIWASGKNRHGENLHTNFSISSDGEPLLLVLPNGNWADLVGPTPLPTDISYGRKPDGTGDFYYFDAPTPGLSNTSPAFQGLLEPPVFSHSSAFYSENLNLSISHPRPEATIIYTLDGSEPTMSNLSGTTYNYKNHYVNFSWENEGQFEQNTYISYTYEAPVLIEDRSQENNKLSVISTTFHENPPYFPQQKVPKGTVVRARAFKEGFIPSEIVSRSFFITPEGRDKWSLPVISLALPEYRLFDYFQGIYVAGVDFDLWRAENLDGDLNGGAGANYHRRGVDTEIRSSLDFFPENERSSALSHDIGIRIHGNWTRAYPQKSFRLYARNQYGEEFLDYDFFGLSQPHNFKRLLLRSSGNDFYGTMFRDAYCQEITRHMNFATQAYLPTTVFLNGEYWGIMNIRERQDKHFLNRHYGVDPENLDILSAWGHIVEGDDLHYRETLDYIGANGLQDQSHYEYIQTRIDVDNFVDYKIANIFLRNTDWPFSNIDFWRLRTESFIPDAPYGHDGRWRWMLYDTDHGFGLAGGDNTYRHNTLAFATEPDGPLWPNPPWSTFLLRSFLENDQFRVFFINRFADQLNTAFLPNRLLDVLEEFKQVLHPEMERHIIRWRSHSGVSGWEDKVKVMARFATHRPEHQRNHIMEYFGLSGTYSAKLDVSHPWHGHVKINTIDLLPSTTGINSDPYPWQGVYFRDIPIEIRAVPAPGYQFSHWAGSNNSNQNPLILQPSQNINLTAHFIPTYQEKLLHFWFFGEALPNNEPLLNIPSSYAVTPGSKIEFVSCLPGYPYHPGHEFWRTASMERRNSPTAINYRTEGNNQISYENTSMRAIQIKQPMVYNGHESALIFHLPTTGKKEAVFRFAVKDEGAADYLIIDYASDSLQNFTQAMLENPVIELTDIYQLVEIDFSPIEAANNNPDFNIRIRLGGEQVHAMDGNRVTFNNFSLDGVVSMAHRITSKARGPGEIYPEGENNYFETEELTFILTPKPNHVLEGLLLDGVSVTEQTQWIEESNQRFYTFQEPVANHTLEAIFSYDTSLMDENDGLLVYPNPTQDILHITSLKKISKLELYDIKGSRIMEIEGNESYFLSLQTDRVNQGLFFLVITLEDGIYTRKIQVLR